MMTFELMDAKSAIRGYNLTKHWDRTKELRLTRALNAIARTTQFNLPYELLNIGESSAGADYESSFDKQPKSGAVKAMISPTKFMSNSYLAWDLEFTLKAGIYAGGFWETVINEEDAIRYAKTFVSQFMSGEGGSWYDDGGLSSAIKQSTEGKELITEITAAFQSKMFLHQGDFTKFTLTDSGIKSPSFQWNSSPTLKILVGGTQQLIIKLSSIFYDVKNSKWSAIINVEIRDDFGVTESDITNASTSAKLGIGGLLDMWVLQKQRGQKPFTSVFNFNFSCSGSY